MRNRSMKIQELIEGMTRQEAIDFLASRIAALNSDIDAFGAAGDDAARLAELKLTLLKIVGG
jgi:hypothetical protein